MAKKQPTPDNLQDMMANAPASVPGAAPAPAPNPDVSGDGSAATPTLATPQTPTSPLAQMFSQGNNSNGDFESLMNLMQRGAYAAPSPPTQIPKFVDNTSPARSLLANMFYGLASGASGQKFQSVRDRKYAEYLDNIKLQQEQQLRDQQLEIARMNVASEFARQNQQQRFQLQQNLMDQYFKGQLEHINTAQGILSYDPIAGKYKKIADLPNEWIGSRPAVANNTIVGVVTNKNTGDQKSQILYQGQPNEKLEMREIPVNGEMHVVAVDMAGKDRNGLPIIKFDYGKKPKPDKEATPQMITDNTGNIYQVTDKGVTKVPGTLPPGSRTLSQQGTLDTPTSVTRSMVEKAPRVSYFVDKLNSQIDAMENKLGPIKGRENDFAQGTGGFKNAGIPGLRVNLGLLETALMNMHVGQRGGEQMMEHFHNLIGGMKQDPSNLREALGAIKDYATFVVNEGKAAGMNLPNQGPPLVNSDADYAKLAPGAAYTASDGKVRIKPTKAVK